jgi:ribonuclease-3
LKAAAFCDSPELPKPDDSSPARFFGNKFKDPDLLTLALTHSSLAYVSNPEGTRWITSGLSFWATRCWAWSCPKALYRLLPAAHEGDLTRLRASLVSSRHLA